MALKNFYSGTAVVCFQLFYFLWTSLVHDLVCGLENGHSKTFARLLNFKLYQEDTQYETTTADHIECVMLCLPDHLCDKISWHEVTKSCHIGRLDNLLSNERVYGSRLEPVSEWTSYEIMAFPVYYMIDPKKDGERKECTSQNVALYRGPSGYNGLIFQDAVALCAAMGTTISSRERMVQAKALGFHRCACGYFSDGTRGFVLNWTNSTCPSHPLESDGIYHCINTSADVYCNVQ